MLHPFSVQTPQELLAHDGYVRALARQLVFEPDRAEDVVQEVWLAALSHAPRDENRLRAWLRVLVLNQVRKSWRGQRRREDREALAVEQPIEVPSPEQLLEHEDVRRQVVEAVAALSDPYRSTLLARYFLELETSEIAEREGVPVETVRTRLKRGHALLRERLDAEHGGRSRWALALVVGMRLEVPSVWRALASGVAARTRALSGMLPLGGRSLVVGWGALLCLLALFLFMRVEPRRSGAGSEPSLTTEAAPAGVVASRPELAAPPRGRGPEREGSRSEVSSEPLRSSLASLLVRLRWQADEEPAEGIWVILELSLSESSGHLRRSARSDPQGEVLFENLPEGYGRLEFGRSGEARAFVLLEPGAQSVEEVQLPEGLELAGVVRDPDGHPVEGASILFEVAPFGRRMLPVASSDQWGRFRLRGVAPGAGIKLCATKAGYIASTSSSERQWGAADELSLLLRPSGSSLEGRVLDRQGRQIEGALVQVGRSDIYEQYELGPPELRMATLTDSQGAFRLDGLVPGWQPVIVIDGRQQRLRSEVELHPGLTTHKDLWLRTTSSVTGRVVGVDGEPAREVQIRLIGDGSTGPSLAAYTDEDGRYELRGVPAGTTLVRALLKGVGGEERVFEVGEGELLEWNILLVPLAPITGRVVGPSGQLAGHTIRVEQEGRSVWQSHSVVTETDATGSFRLDELLDGPYTLSLLWRDGGLLVREGVRPGQSLLLEP